MLLNIKKNAVHKKTDCTDCEFWNAVTKKCSGLNKRCFKFDEATGTAIDLNTGLPLKIGGIKNGN